MKEEQMAGFISRRAALVLNILIVAGYVAIAILAPSPWIMFAGFLLLAVAIRSATMYWMMRWASRETGETVQSQHLVVLWNVVAGLLFSTLLVVGLWWLGRFWLSGVKIIVPCLAVFVAFKSTFPLAFPKKQVDNLKSSPNKASEATSGSAPGAPPEAPQG